jgi:thiol-disulfide isomerase/thioredoxin
MRPVVLLPLVASIVLVAACTERAAPSVTSAATSSPALLAGGTVPGLPTQVAELPTADTDAFRTLLADLQGIPVVVNLWASWCEPCTREMPMLSDAAAAHPDVQFIGVDTLDSRGGAEAFIADYGVPFPSLFDPDGAIRTDLGSFGLPVTVFFDAEGNQVEKVDGELSQSALDEHLAAIST